MNNVYWFGIEVDRGYHVRFLWTLNEDRGSALITDKIAFATSDLESFIRQLRAVLEPIWKRDELPETLISERTEEHKAALARVIAQEETL